MIKYADIVNEGSAVQVMSGDLKGKKGIVKQASVEAGLYVIRLSSGEEVEIDEMAFKQVPKE